MLVAAYPKNTSTYLLEPLYVIYGNRAKVVMDLKKFVVILLVILVSTVIIGVMALENSRLEARRIVNEILGIRVPNISRILEENTYPSKDLKIYINTLVDKAMSIIEEVAELRDSNPHDKRVHKPLLEYANRSLNNAIEALAKNNLIEALDHAKSAIITAKHAEIYEQLVLNKTTPTEVMKTLKEDLEKLRILHQEVLNEYTSYLRKEYIDPSLLYVNYKIELKLISTESLLKRAADFVSKNTIDPQGKPGNIRFDWIAGMAENLELAKYNLEEAQILLKRLGEAQVHEGMKITTLYEKLYEILLARLKEVESKTNRSSLAYELLEKIKGIKSIAERMSSRGYYVYSLIRVLEGLTYIKMLEEYNELNTLPAVTNGTRDQGVTINDLKELLKAKREAVNVLKITLNDTSRPSPYSKILLILLTLSESKIKRADQGLWYLKENPLYEIARHHYLTLFYKYIEAKYYTLKLKDTINEIKQLTNNFKIT